MKRWTLRILVFLLLGTVVNVAVAWACVLRDASFREIHPTEFRWPIPVPPGFEQPVWGHGLKAFGFTSLGAWVNTATGDPGCLNVQLAGWPLRAFCAERHYVKQGLGIPGLQRFDSPASFWDGIAIPERVKGNSEYRCLPTGPLWPGFAINTVFYAAVVWMLFAAPFALRRRRRVERSLCPKCAYDLRSGRSNTCPECGITQ